MTGLEDCPNLEEIRIKKEGDCRGKHKLDEPELDLSCLALYPKLSKMQLDCWDTFGDVLTAPPCTCRWIRVCGEILLDWNCSRETPCSSQVIVMT
ncbi:hypothetical protein YC2023_048438 [Brassica napus]